MYHCLDLSKYVNNKGITSFEDREQGELDSFIKLSIPDSFLQKHMNFSYKDDSVPFIFNIDGIYDNIEINNQSIHIEPKSYSDIFLIGTCNNGNFYHDLLIKNDESSLIKRAYFSDLFDEEPSNKEICFKHINYMHSPQGINESFSPRLWFFHISLENSMLINQIKFDYNPFIHIFSITLKETEK
ncbi:hypothetical protein ACQVOM_12240 [Bacillus basilensis]|uniref:hypothetical protein n=1 Tax=Bacillus cereus group TaxID=86661 RepID=UPI000BED0B7B|nr:hypothetical protein [Bacillus toyonensis]PEC08066.1 hypothetical protein CON55_25965 [Bacillus toyonensis]